MRPRYKRGREWIITVTLGKGIEFIGDISIPFDHKLQTCRSGALNPSIH